MTADSPRAEALWARRNAGAVGTMSAAEAVVETAALWWRGMLTALAVDGWGWQGADSRTNAVLVFSIRVASAGLLFGSQVLLARWMGAADYGIYVALWTAVLVAGGLSHLGLNMTMMRLVPQYLAQGSANELRGLLRGGRAFAILVGTLLAVVGGVVIWAAGSAIRTDLVWPMLLALACLPAYALTDVQDGLSRGQRWTIEGLVPPYLVRPVLVLLFVAAAQAAGLPATATYGLVAALAATWWAALIQSLLIERRLNATVAEGPRTFAFLQWMRISLPLLAMGGCELVLQNADVLTLSLYRPAAEIGVYYAAAKTTALGLFVHYAVGSAYAGRIAAAGALRDREVLCRLAREAATWTFWPTLAIVALVLAAGGPLLSLFGPGFSDATPIMWVLALGILARAAMGPAETILAMLGEQRACALAYAAAAAVCIALNLLLIPNLGAMGAAIATATAFATASFLSGWFVRRRLGLDVFVLSGLFCRGADGVRPASQSTGVVQRGDAEVRARIAFAIADDMVAFEALREDWTSLFARAGRSQHLFQTFDWNRTWARHFLAARGGASGPLLAIVTGRIDGRLAVVWPLVLQRTAGLRQIVWMGEPASQYGDILVEPGPEAADLVRRSWAFLHDRLRPDIVTLRKVREDAAIAPFLGAIGARLTSSLEAPYLDLASAPSFEAFETRYSGKARKNRRRLLRRLAEKGHVAFVHHGHGPDARRLARRAIEMKKAWLDHRNLLAPALRDPRLQSFFEDYAMRRGSGPAIQVSALELDGEPLAIMVAVASGGRSAGHVFAYDVRFEGSGVGVLLLEELIRKGCGDGISTLDLMAPADAYKLDWTETSAGVGDWSIALSLPGRLYRRFYLELLKGRVKRSAEALPEEVRRLIRTRLLSPAGLDEPRKALETTGVDADPVVRPPSERRYG